MKNIAILGSTGSIGTQTLDVVRRNPDEFHVSVIAANSSDEMLEKQIEEFSPEAAVLFDSEAAARLRSRYTGKTKILDGKQGLIDGAVYPDVDTVVTSLMGFAGLAPTLAALDAGKNIALANKETLVVAGELVMRRRREGSINPSRRQRALCVVSVPCRRKTRYCRKAYSDSIRRSVPR
jgi:1-deoxy-D-xylulose-5-phosphate reductoisomerase